MAAETIIDGLLAADSEMQRQRTIREKERQLFQNTRRCGSCELWMTAKCLPERQHGQFKSCDDSACELFQLSYLGGKRQQELEAELVQLRNV